MFRHVRFGWIALAAAVAGVVAMGLATTAQGSAAHQAPNDCTMSVTQDNPVLHPIIANGCTPPGPVVMWAPPVGAIGPNGQVVKTQINGSTTGYGYADFKVNGRPMNDATVDELRVPSGPMRGRVRLFMPDPPSQGSTPNTPSSKAQAAAAKLGAEPVPGMIDVTPAPATMYPITPGRNSLGWATATG